MASYNYGSYAAAYGQQQQQQQYAQPTSYNSQQPSSTGYGQYSQSSYGSSSTTSTTQASTTNTNSYGYAAASVTTSSNTSNYGFSGQTGGYNYGYSSDSTGYNTANSQNSALQAFQQSWYNTPPAQTATGTATTTQPSAATTAQQQAVQQHQYGSSYQSQYMQQIQQMSAYQQQYGNTNTGSQQQGQYGGSTSGGQQQGMFKPPQPVGTKPRSAVQAAAVGTGKIDQQQSTGWGSYTPAQRQQTTATNRQTDISKQTGWGSYQQQSATGQAASPSNQQQKPTGVVYRSPMKYTQNDGQQGSYGAGLMNQGYNANQGYKSSNTNPAQGYNSSNQGYNTTNQGYNSSMTQGYGMNQGYSGANQSFNAPNQQFKTQTGGAYNAAGYNNNHGFSTNQQPGFGNNFTQNFGNQNFNKGYSQSGPSRNDAQQTGRSPSGPVQKMPTQRGPMEAPFQPYQQQQGGMMGHGRGGPANMAARGRGGIRPMMGRGSPVSANVGFGPPARAGPQDGPDIPPFPQAWHSQDLDGPGDWQRAAGPGGFNDGPNRWNRGGGMQSGSYNQQQPQAKGIYNINSRNPRGATSSNRELWSPAGKKENGSGASSSDRESKSMQVKKEDNETATADKDKQTEIKSFLYAWLGSRHARPVYDIRQVGERPNISFRCDLRVDSYHFVGVGEASSKKEAQTAAAWDFADFLVKKGELGESDLPPRHLKLLEELEGDFGTVKYEEEKDSGEGGGRRRENEDRYRNRDGRNDGRRREPRYQQNWGGRGRPGMGRGPPQMEIQPLMAHPIGPWEGPPMGMPPHHHHHMGPPPRMMDYGNHWDDRWGFPMGPPPILPMRPGPPPPMMRRNQNEYWRRRDMEERMHDMKWNQGDWQNPEDIFINQMIKIQQESEMPHGQRPPNMLPLEAMPGEWHSVAQSRPVVTSDDRHVMAKHAEIYPQEGELKNLHRIVNTVEQALKLLSDKFVDEDHPRDVEKEETDKEEKETKDGGEDKEEKKEQESGDTKEEETKEDKDNEETKKEEKRAKIKILKRPKKTPKQVDTRPRVLCGVNRIGPLAKGLLISKDDRVDLALLCGEIPTLTLLNRIMEHVQEKLTSVDKDFELTLERMEEEAGFLVKSKDESSPVQVMVTLTATALRKGIKKEKGGKEKEEKNEEKSLESESVKTEESQEKSEEKSMESESEKTEEGEEKTEEKSMESESEIKEEKTNDEEDKTEEKSMESESETKEEKTNDEEEKTEEKSMESESEIKEEKKNEEEEKAQEPDPVGMLPKQKMLDALACLRHTHWFQGKACSVQSCVILTRIVRDLQRRDEVWSALPEWPLEVLIYNCLFSSDEQMSPGDACRRFLEVIAGGILQPGMPGMQDPCEKTATKDILDSVLAQEKELMTRSAQSYLRRLAFREIHQFLGMDKLPPTYKMSQDSRSNSHYDRPFNKHAELKEREENKNNESNNQRKRRFEHNGSDSVAESPKRSLTDEEDTDTQQNLAELSISDEASEGRSALDETDVDATASFAAVKESSTGEPVVEEAKKEEEVEEEEQKELLSKDNESMETEENLFSKEEEDAPLEDKMDTKDSLQDA